MTAVSSVSANSYLTCICENIKDLFESITRVAMQAFQSLREWLQALCCCSCSNRQIQSTPTPPPAPSPIQPSVQLPPKPAHMLMSEYLDNIFCWLVHRAQYLRTSTRLGEIQGELFNRPRFLLCRVNLTDPLRPRSLSDQVNASATSIFRIPREIEGYLWTHADKFCLCCVLDTKYYVVHGQQDRLQYSEGTLDGEEDLVQAISTALEETGGYSDLWNWEKLELRRLGGT